MVSKKHNVIIAGAGRIGSLIAYLLANSGDYNVALADISAQHLHLDQPVPNLTPIQLDATDEASLADFLQRFPAQAIISCLPYFCNTQIAFLAKKMGLYYFDMTEDVRTIKIINDLAANQPIGFVPACGIAPGFVNIVAHHLMQGFDELESVKLRVGSLPLNTDNALQYALIWSTDGIINEYGNPCQAIVDGRLVELQPLENVESVELDGIVYEAFNTSGGVGALAETYAGKIKNLNYKTMRYPGHCEKMRFLMKDLKLNEDRVTLKRILENVLPMNTEDVTLIYVNAQGKKLNLLTEEIYVNKFYAQTLFDRRWSAIQITTASSASAVIDLVLTNPKKYRGLVLQEQFALPEFLNNRFGKIFNTTR